MSDRAKKLALWKRKVLADKMYELKVSQNENHRLKTELQAIILAYPVTKLERLAMEAELKLAHFDKVPICSNEHKAPEPEPPRALNTDTERIYS